jgi:hypothetical protein
MIQWPILSAPNGTNIIAIVLIVEVDVAVAEVEIHEPRVVGKVCVGSTGPIPRRGFGQRVSETEEHDFVASSQDERYSTNTGYGAVSGATPS